MVQRLDFLEKVRPFVGLDVIKVLTGMRRSGKSVLMEQIREMIRTQIDPKGNFVFINLELDENKRFLEKGVLHKYVMEFAEKDKSVKTYVFLD